jgi:hypothetical protein
MGGPCIVQLVIIIPLIAKTVSGQKYTAEAREELYERARTALMTEFAKLDPPASDAEAALRDMGNRWPDEVPVPTFGPRMVCTGCGIIGADARPNWKQQPARESLTGVQWPS